MNTSICCTVAWDGNEFLPISSTLYFIVCIIHTRYAINQLCIRAHIDSRQIGEVFIPVQGPVGPSNLKVIQINCKFLCRPIGSYLQWVERNLKKISKTTITTFIQAIYDSKQQHHTVTYFCQDYFPGFLIEHYFPRDFYLVSNVIFIITSI